MAAVADAATRQEQVIVGKIVGIHGLQGWLKVHSYCEPRERIFEYGELLIGERLISRFEGKVHGKGLLLRLEDHPDRTAVEPLVGQTICVRRQQLPELDDGEYYWSDLEGLEVINQQGKCLGTVNHLMATGANDVLVVKGGPRQLLIPYVAGQYVVAVDLKANTMTVDWSLDWL